MCFSKNACLFTQCNTESALECGPVSGRWLLKCICGLFLKGHAPSNTCPKAKTKAKINKHRMKPHRVQLYQQILSNYSGTMFNVVKVTHLSRSVFRVLKSAGDRRWTWCMSKLRPEATSSESVSTSHNSNMLLHGNY